MDRTLFYVLIVCYVAIGVMVLTNKVLAEQDYVVNGDSVYKIEVVSVNYERDILLSELEQATAQVESYKENIIVQQDGLAKAEQWKKYVEDKLLAIAGEPKKEADPVVVDEVVYPDLNSKSGINW